MCLNYSKLFLITLYCTLPALTYQHVFLNYTFSYGTYHLSFTELEGGVCEATLTVIRRLPLSSRNGISSTCAGHITLAGLQTRTRESMIVTNVGLRPAQCD